MSVSSSPLSISSKQKHGSTYRCFEVKALPIHACIQGPKNTIVTQLAESLQASETAFTVHNIKSFARIYHCLYWECSCLLDRISLSYSALLVVSVCRDKIKDW
jgi:hypothetical protein